jgi:hypothetical protein
MGKREKVQNSCHGPERTGKSPQHRILSKFSLSFNGMGAALRSSSETGAAGEKVGWTNLITLGQFLDHFFLVLQGLEVHGPKGLPADKGGFFSWAIPFGSEEHEVLPS